MNSSVSTILRPVFLLAFMVLVMSTSRVGAQSSPPDNPGGDAVPVNAMCPVMPEEPVDPRFTVQYEGKTIGLCCRRCLTKFDADPSAYIANLPVSFQSQSKEGIHEHSDSREPRAPGNADGNDDHDHQHRETATASSPPDAEEHSPDDGSSGDGGDGHAHSHESAHRSILAVWIGKFHPPATDLPIGLLIGAAVAELCLIFTKKAWFRPVAGFCLALGTFGALGAATLGWFNGGPALWDGDWVQATHRWLGTGTAVLSVVTLVLYIRVTRAKSGSHPAFWYRTSLFITTSLVGAAGFFGGALVYGINHYAW